MRWPLAAAAVVLAAGARAQAQVDSGATPIRLDEAIRLAQAAEPAAVAARGARETSVAGLRSAYAAFIPSLTISTSTTAHEPAGAPVTNPVTGLLTSGKWQSTQGFSFAVDIFDGGRRIYDVASARALLGAADAGEIAQRYQTAYDVKVQFYAVLAAREQRISAQAALDAAEEQMRQSVLKVVAKTVTKSDSLQSLVAVGNARLQILAADLALQQANATLTRLVAAPTMVTAAFGDSVRDSLTAMDSAAISRLLPTAPSVVQANANLDAANASATASRSTWFPQISVSYGRNRTSADTMFNLSCCAGSYSGQFRFTLSWTVFNQWQRESSIVQADVAAANADAAARDAKYAARQLLVQDYGALRTAQEQTAIQLVSVAAAEENLRVEQERYRLSVSSILDVLTAQSTLNSARLLLIQARFNYRVAKSQLEALVGRDL